MRKLPLFVVLACFALLSGCSSTVLVPVAPRVDLKSYPTLGLIEFASNGDAATNAYATQQFQEQVQAAQPGTRFIELGAREALLAAVGARQLDAEAYKRIGAKYGVAGVFVGSIAYSEPKTDIKLTDLTRLEGGVQSEIKGDISAKLVETRTGAGVWSSSAWVRRQIGRLSVSAEYGVSAGLSKSDPQHEMVPGLVHHLTQDFRPSSMRQPAK